jgi:CRISPR/Cas system-associated exonuclease Cas4 (RecB family)
MASITRNIHRLIDAAVRVLPIEESFLADLTSSIEKQDETRMPSKSYKPSSLNCIRNMYFQVTGVTPDAQRADSTLIGICQSGSARHEYIQQAIADMKKIKIDCEYVDVGQFVESRKPKGTIVRSKQGMETKCFNEILNISFLCDGIIKYKNQYFILEIKTESFYKWQGRNQVVDDHLTQASAYSTCLGIDRVMFLYENRDNCAKKCFVVDITDEMRQTRVIGKIEECNNYIRMLTVPPKCPDKKQCTYCGYKTDCKKAGA